MMRVAAIDGAKMYESSAATIEDAPDPGREHEYAHHHGR